MPFVPTLLVPCARLPTLALACCAVACLTVRAIQTDELRTAIAAAERGVIKKLYLASATFQLGGSPLVVKPGRQVYLWAGEFSRSGVWPVIDGQSLSRIFDVKGEEMTCRCVLPSYLPGGTDRYAYH